MYRLDQNDPNPFSDGTTVTYALPRASYVILEVLNRRGERVRLLIDEIQEPGDYAKQWDGKDDNGRHVACGVYLYRMTTRVAGGGAFMQSREMKVES